MAVDYMVPKAYCDAALFHLGQRKKAGLPQHGFGREGNLTQVSKQPWSTQLSSNGEAGLWGKGSGDCDTSLYFTFLTLLRAMKLLSES